MRPSRRTLSAALVVCVAGCEPGLRYGEGPSPGSLDLCNDVERLSGPGPYDVEGATIVADAERRLPSGDGACTSPGHAFELEVETPDGHAWFGMTEHGPPHPDGLGSNQDRDDLRPDVALASAGPFAVVTSDDISWVTVASLTLSDGDGLVLAAEMNGALGHVPRAVGGLAVSDAGATRETSDNGCTASTWHALRLEGDDGETVELASGESGALHVDGHTVDVKNVSSEVREVGADPGDCPTDGVFGRFTSWYASRRP